MAKSSSNLPVHAWAKVPADGLSLLPAFKIGIVFFSAIGSSFLFMLAMRLNLIGTARTTYKPDFSICSCDCWDRQFKGNYHDYGYKSVYFQLNRHAALVLLWAAVYFAFLLEFVKMAAACLLGSLGFNKLLSGSRKVLPELRWHVLLCSCMNLYGSFYNFWTTFNYLNDRPPTRGVNRLFYTQTYFNVTELIPAMALYQLLPRKSRPNEVFLILAMSTCIAHQYLSIADQGWQHLIHLDAHLIRDFAFIASDLCGVLPILVHLGFKRVAQRSVLLVIFAIGQVGLYALIKRAYGYDQV